MRPLFLVGVCLLSACASLPRAARDCPPTYLPKYLYLDDHWDEKVDDTLPIEARLGPGDYEFTAVSRDRRASVTGKLRLWATSSTDSAKSPYTGEWVSVPPGDTARHPLIGVSNVDLYSTKIGTEQSLDELQVHSNPIYPPILVRRGEDPANRRVRIEMVSGDPSGRSRDFSMEDGVGVLLTVAHVQDGFFRGYYSAYGIVGPMYGPGYFCAKLVSPGG